MVWTNLINNKEFLIKERGATVVTNIYDEMEQIITQGFVVPEMQKDDDNEEYTTFKYYLILCKKFLKSKYKVYLIGLIYILILGHMMMSSLELLSALYNVNTSYLMTNPLRIVASLLIPFVIWIWSTNFDEWNFHSRKLMGIRLCLVNVVVTLTHIIYLIWCGLLLPYFVKIPPNPEISLQMIFNLTRLILTLLTVIPSTVIVVKILGYVNNEVTKQVIYSFKLYKNIDFRTDKKFRYDLQVVADLETGKPYTIKEKDRSLHSIGNGVTGTGKTTLLFTVSIAHDIEKMVSNLKYQKSEVKSYIKRGLIRMKKPMSDGEFDIDNFEVIKGKEDILHKLKFKAPIAGMSAMAPNASFSDEIYEIAKLKGVKVNRLDPTLDSNRKIKEGFRGFNPLYINPNITGLDRIIEITKKATLFADVTQAVFETSGSSDVYFASVNKNVTTSVTSLILLTYSDLNNGEQPTPRQVQEVLNDFAKAKPYRAHLVRKYGKRNEAGEPIMEEGRADVGLWQSVLDFVDNELLGKGVETMFHQSRGIRIIVNSFLENPLVANALCSKDSIDLDVALEKGELTVVNYALELGTQGMAFGMFFLLSFIQAVFRRPGKESTRLPHYFYIDEFPVLLHPKVEACFSLFRQYRVAMFVAIQSLTQMEKSSSTAFLKDLLLGNCAHHFVFGRVATQEMKLYSELAGTEYTFKEMKGTTETSLTTDNPSISFTKREQMERTNVVEGSDLRYQDFKEMFVITVDQGSPVSAFHGKGAFLPDYKRIKSVRSKIDWNKYYEEIPIEVNEQLNENENVGEELEIEKENANESENKEEFLFNSFSQVNAYDNFYEDGTQERNDDRMDITQEKKSYIKETIISDFAEPHSLDSYHENLNKKHSRNILDDIDMQYISGEENNDQLKNEEEHEESCNTSKENNAVSTHKQKKKISHDNVNSEGYIDFSD